MDKYRLSNSAKEDLIRIHHFGVEKFGTNQADKYFESFFDFFEIIVQRPFSFESVDYIKEEYKRYPCGLVYNGEFVTTDLSVCLDSRFDKVIEKEKKRKEKKRKEKKYKRIVSCIANHPSAYGAIKDWQRLITEL